MAFSESTNQAAKEGNQVLKGTRWLLLKNQENLNDSRNEKQRLDEALLLNKSLATAYYIKEDLRQLWSQSSKEDGSVFLNDWMARARSPGIKMIISFSGTLEEHRAGILAYYDFPVSTGPLERTNNKFKTLQKQAHGYRDMSIFKLKIHTLYETKYAIVG